MTNRSVLRWQRSGEGEAALLSDLAAYAYTWPRLYRRADEDAGGDFLLTVHPHLLWWARRYEDKGYQFVTYFARRLSWAWENHRRRQEEQAARFVEAVSVGNIADHPAAAAPEEDDATPPTVAAVRAPKTKVGKRRLLVAAALGGDSDQVAAVAQACGAQIDLGRLRDPAVNARRELYAARRDRAWESLCAHERLARMPRIGERRRRLYMVRAARARRAWIAARRALSSVRRAPTHRQVAAALGYPKGSVGTLAASLERA